MLVRYGGPLVAYDWGRKTRQLQRSVGFKSLRYQRQ